MILVISDLWLPFPGGAERLIFNLSRDLATRGEEVQVLTSYAAAQRFDGPPVEFRSLGVELFHADGARDLLAYIAEVRPDVILTHHYFAFQFAAELEACGVPIAQVVLNGRRLPFAQLAVFISDFVRSMPGMEPQPGDLTILPYACPDVIAAPAIGGPGDAIGFIKPLPHKGVELVYEIARLLPAKRFLILRGEWQDIEIIRQLPNVEFMEPAFDIRDFYAQCRLILVPSLSEDAGTVAQEATLNGLPCISSDAGGLPETNRGGILLDTRDPQVWVEVIEALDDGTTYSRQAERQRAALPDQSAQLDALAFRLGAIAARARMQ